MGGSRRRHAPLVATYAALVVCALIVAGPLLLVLLKATQSNEQVFSARLLPGSDLWRNVREAWTSANLGRFMTNSLFIALVVTLGKTILALLAALAFVFFRFPLKGMLFALVLFTLMLPFDLLTLSLFGLITHLGWANTYLAIIVPFLADATGTFLFRQHFLSMPASLPDAARIDGCGPLRYLLHVLVPLSTNTIGAMAVIQFVYVWDQYLWPLVIMQDDGKQVIQVGIKRLVGVSGQTDWGVLMAGTVISLLPPLLLFSVLQEQFSKGFAFGQDK